PLTSTSALSVAATCPMGQEFSTGGSRDEPVRPPPARRAHPAQPRRDGAHESCPHHRRRAGDPAMASYYAQRATAGLVVSEGVHPNRVGRSNPGAPGLVTDEHVAAWRPVTAAVHVNGGRIFAQIMHGG